MICLDPEETWEIEFDHQADRPAAQRHGLVCRFLSAQKYGQLARLGEAANADDPKIEIEARMRMVGEALAIGAVRWRDGKPFNIDTLSQMLTVAEHWELLSKMLSGQRLAEADRKKFALQSASAAATPAGSGAAPAA